MSPAWDDALTGLYLRGGALVVNLSVASFNVHSLCSNGDTPQLSQEQYLWKQVTTVSK
jgi:hypothetical protein